MERSSDSNTSTSTTFPETTEISKTPLTMALESVNYTDTYGEFMFILEHTDESPISSDDYQFQWPKYVADDQDVIYEIKSVDFSHSEVNGRTLENHELSITLHITPPPSDSNRDQYIHIPLYIVPSLFEEGYPFLLTEDSLDRLEVGDLVLENIFLEEKTLSFEMSDQENLSYLFTRLQENQRIYPLFSRIEPDEHSFHVLLEFAQPVSLPTRLMIERTEANLPEWRFSFFLPMDESDTSE